MGILQRDRLAGLRDKGSFSLFTGVCMHLNVRTVNGRDAQELYICAAPDSASDWSIAAQEMFASVEEVARQHDARICRRRVFVPEGQLTSFPAASCDMQSADAPPVPTDWLSAGAAPIAGGIQAHALRGKFEWKPLCYGGRTLGWSVARNGCRWAVTGDVHVTPAAEGPEQAKQAFEIAEALLEQAGMDLSDVARTWIFLRDILSWYPKFNDARTRLFVERGLMRRVQPAGALQVPASTGMGVKPASSADIALELFAAAGPEGTVRRFSAAGRQRSACEYGSSFARAAEAHTPAGRTVFVSGTAAIDANGASCCMGDIRGQIAMTIQNILAVLRDLHCSPRDVVEAIAYCKNMDVVNQFRQGWMREMDWPWLAVIGDICRPELLFEVEVTACQGDEALFAVRPSDRELKSKIA